MLRASLKPLTFVYKFAILSIVLSRRTEDAFSWPRDGHGRALDKKERRFKLIRSHIHHKGHRNKPLSKYKQQVNKRRSKVRVRVEHVFGHQQNNMGGTLVRTIGMARAKTKIGLKNLAYNMQRFVFLLRTGQRCGQPSPV
ncbi:MAG: transposase [Alphaproteobacteria bacterium]